MCAGEITRSEVFLVMKGNFEFDYACEPASKPEFERETESETAQPVCLLSRGESVHVCAKTKQLSGRQRFQSGPSAMK